MDLVGIGGRETWSSVDVADSASPVLEATGAVLFTTLELRRRLVVQAAGSMRTRAPAGVHLQARGRRESVLRRTASWLLGLNS